MKGCHDPHSGPVLLPSRLVFYLGNYTGGAFSARWNGNAIIVEETRGGNFNGNSTNHFTRAGTLGAILEGD